MVGLWIFWAKSLRIGPQPYILLWQVSAFVKSFILHMLNLSGITVSFVFHFLELYSSASVGILFWQFANDVGEIPHTQTFSIHS